MIVNVSHNNIITIITLHPLSILVIIIIIIIISCYVLLQLRRAQKLNVEPPQVQYSSHEY